MKELLEYLARGLVEEPDEVTVVEVQEDDGVTVLELSVGDDDYGNVIGRGGRTASALRTIIKTAATKQQAPGVRGHRRLLMEAGAGGHPSGWLRAGRVGRPHGLDGSFHVVTPNAALIGVVSHLTVGGRELEIVRQAGTASRPIVRLEGCEDREAAEALRGEELLVPREAAPELEARRVVGRGSRRLRGARRRPRGRGGRATCSRCRRARCSRCGAWGRRPTCSCR